MKNRFVTAVLIGAVLLLSGCASTPETTGPTYGEISHLFPALKPGEGRVFFFRERSRRGNPTGVTLNDEYVGPAKAGTFFYVDRPAGSYTAKARIEWEMRVSFTLTAGETKYIILKPMVGIRNSNLALAPMEPHMATGMLHNLVFTGTLPGNAAAPAGK